MNRNRADLQNGKDYLLRYKRLPEKPLPLPVYAHLYVGLFAHRPPDSVLAGAVSDREVPGGICLSCSEKFIRGYWIDIDGRHLHARDAVSGSSKNDSAYYACICHVSLMWTVNSGFSLGVPVYPKPMLRSGLLRTWIDADHVVRSQDWHLLRDGLAGHFEAAGYRGPFRAGTLGKDAEGRRSRSYLLLSSFIFFKLLCEIRNAGSLNLFAVAVNRFGSVVLAQFVTIRRGCSSFAQYDR